MKIYGTLLLFTLAQSLGFGQKWKFESITNFGLDLNLNLSKAQKFPSFRLFVGISAVGRNGENFFVSYAPTISIYKKTIGSNLNPLLEDIQVDLNNSFSVGGEWGHNMNAKFLRNIHNSNAYNIVINKHRSILVSTNFIFNSNKRHQIVGSATGNIGIFSLTYYNDAIPFNNIGIADGFDRYWTGGGIMYLHGTNNFNLLELSFDQFTGYEPLIYELSKLLNIDVPNYNKNEKRSNYNTSTYMLRIGIDRYTSLNIGVLGSLVSKSGRFYGFQDLIHIKGKYSLHPNTDSNKTVFGVTFQNNLILK